MVTLLPKGKGRVVAERLDIWRQAICHFVALSLVREVARDLSDEGNSMTATRRKDGLSKFRRYRQNQGRQGMKLMRLRVPDPHREGFAAEAARQAALLRSAPEEVDAPPVAE
jgi:hypothetical protein